MDALDLVSFLCIGISLAAGVINLCWLYSYNAYKEYDAIRSRRPQSSIVWGIFSTMSYFIVYPIFLLFTNTTILPFYDWYFIMNNTLSVTIPATTVYILSYRVYMIYFDIKWMTALQDKKWRLYIDPQEKNWFLKYKNSFGNTKKVAIIFFIQWITFGLLSILLSSFNILFAKALNSFIGSAHLIFTFILYCKWPKYSDSWYISNEVKLFLKVYFSCVIFYFIVGLLLNAQPHSYQYALVMAFASLSGISVNYIVFCYPLKKFNYKTNPSSARKDKVTNKTLSIISMSSKDGTNSNYNYQEIDIKQILENKHGFNEFACYLTSEWCIENLLFFVETQQWIVSLSSNKKYTNLNADNKMIFQYPENSPKSRIITLDDECLGIIKLYEKYIRNGSDFCVNISYMTRNAIRCKLNVDDNKSNKDIIKLLQTLTSDVIFDIFDEARLEVFRLMEGSVTRFKNTDQYARICKEIIV